MQHFVIVIQVVDKVSDEEQVVSLERREVSDGLCLFLGLDLLTLELRWSVCLAVMARQGWLNDIGLISVLNCQGRSIQGCESVSRCQLCIR